MDKVILLEFEGVVADSRSAFCRACAESLRAAGHADLADEEVILRLNEEEWSAALRREGVSVATEQSMVTRFSELCCDESACRPVPGISAVVADLARRNSVIAVSWATSEAVRDFCARHGIEGFSAILGSESEPSHVQKIRRVKAEHGQRSYWYVGDSVTNVREGRAAGIGTIGVAWGWHDVARLREALPDHIAYTPADLLVLA